jgi:hypothetical protein
MPKISPLFFASVPIYLFLNAGQDWISDGIISGDEMYLAENSYRLRPAASLFTLVQDRGEDHDMSKQHGASEVFQRESVQ